MYFFLVLTGDDSGEVLGDVLDEDREGPCPVLAGFNTSKSESLLLDTYIYIYAIFRFRHLCSHWGWRVNSKDVDVCI